MKNEVTMQNGRAVFIRAPKRLSQAQLTIALQSMADDDPRWLAINQVLDEELAAAVLDVSAPATANRDHAGGRVDALATAKQRLSDERKKIVTPDPRTTRSKR